jgi:hypothetical protein
MKKLVLIAILLLLGTNLMAQSSVPNVLNYKSVKSSGAIVSNEKVSGYYMFYFKEKNDKKTSTYEVILFDDNYNSVRNFEITRPSRTSLVEIVYNGDVFMLFYYDAKTGFEFITYNREGKELGNQKISKKEISSFALQSTLAASSSGSDSHTIYPNGNKGFFRTTFSKNKKMGYELISYDNELNELWRSESPKTSKMLESIGISDVSEKYIAAVISRRKSAMTRKIDMAFCIFDSKTGELIKEVPMGTKETGKKSVLKTYVDPESDLIMLIGEFFMPGDDILKDKSAGIFIKELDSEGEELSNNEYKWKGDIDKYKNNNLTEEDKKEAKASFSLFFHNVIRSKDGHLFLVAEQFKKQVSAGGIAMNVASAALGGNANAANFEIRISNMVIIELDKNNKLFDYHIIKKKRNSVYLQQGAGLYSSAFLGYYVNSLGAFDYSYTSADKTKDEFNVVYTDLNKKEKKGEDKNDRMIGVIEINQGALTSTRVPINSDTKRLYIQRAKHGHVAIREYYKKEKRLEMRLEKLTY